MLTETWIDRTDWESGPWDSEPDRIEWRDETTGLPCLILRQVRGGNWCGYVGLPPGHPWHGAHYDSENYDRLEPAHDAAHGGLTFAGPCMDDERPARERVCHVPAEGESGDVWWLGFDCHHAWDQAPGSDADHRMLAKKYRAEGDIASAELFERLDLDTHYRAAEYVRQCVADLATACAAAWSC